MDEDLSNVKGVSDRLADIQLVDCREQYEWDAGRVDGAVHIPLNTLMAGGGPSLDPSKPVAVICRSGNRSELATMMLQARGFEAHNVEGGMEAWEAAGLPFEAPDGSAGRVARGRPPPPVGRQLLIRVHGGHGLLDRARVVHEVVGRVARPRRDGRVRRRDLLEPSASHELAVLARVVLPWL
jgi:rhodanese-related sulfurtransferase